MDFLYSNFIEIARKWQTEGWMRQDIYAEMIMAIFTALVVIETHKDEIGIFHLNGLMSCSVNTSPDNRIK